jgi:hypothetical protein
MEYGKDVRTINGTATLSSRGQIDRGPHVKYMGMVGIMVGPLWVHIAQMVQYFLNLFLNWMDHTVGWWQVDGMIQMGFPTELYQAVVFVVVEQWEHTNVFYVKQDNIKTVSRIHNARIVLWIHSLCLQATIQRIASVTQDIRGQTEATVWLAKPENTRASRGLQIVFRVPQTALPLLQGIFNGPVCARLDSREKMAPPARFVQRINTKTWQLTHVLNVLRILYHLLEVTQSKIVNARLGFIWIRDQAIVLHALQTNSRRLLVPKIALPVQHTPSHQKAVSI